MKWKRFDADFFSGRRRSSVTKKLHVTKKTVASHVIALGAGLLWAFFLPKALSKWSTIAAVNL